VVEPLPQVSTVSAVDLRGICIGLAAMNATVGAIVVVFVVLAVQELRTLRSQAALKADLPRSSLRDESRLDMLLGVTIWAFLILMADAILMVFGMLANLLPLETIAAIGLGGFTYGVSTVMVSLFSYRILESPFRRLSGQSAWDVDEHQN
jgi:hypothetical protein